MALNIKDPETDRVVRQLAEATGESITVAIRTAAEERLRRVRVRKSDPELRAFLDDLIATGRAERDLDPRTPDEIIGYDEYGLPT